MKQEDLIRKRIRNLREEAKLSQKDMADKLNIELRNYARLERGERKQLDLQLLLAIADALEIELIQLLEPLIDHKDSKSKNSFNPIDESVEEHYKAVITQLLEVVENQRNIIEMKNKALQN